MKNKIRFLIIIIVVLLIIISYLLYLNFGVKFNKPSFDSNVIKNVSYENYKESMITVSNDYRLFINGNPYYKDGYLYISFYSGCSDDIYLKVRIIKDDKVIGESGLIKKNELLKMIKINYRLNLNDEITYLVMGYTDKYFSAGELRLNVKVSDISEKSN